MLYDTFNKSIVLEEVMRQDHDQLMFKQMLSRIRDGEVGIEDWRLLNFRMS